MKGRARAGKEEEGVEKVVRTWIGWRVRYTFAVMHCSTTLDPLSTQGRDGHILGRLMDLPSPGNPQDPTQKKTGMDLLFFF